MEIAFKLNLVELMFDLNSIWIVCVCVYVWVCVYVFVCVCVYVCVCMWVYVWVCVNVCVEIYVSEGHKVWISKKQKNDRIMISFLIDRKISELFD